MGLEGENHPVFGTADVGWSIYDHIPPDDPFAPSTTQAIATAMRINRS